MDRMLRPKAAVLPDAALVAAPTHALEAGQPYYADGDTARAEEVGRLRKGAKVAVVEPGDEWSTVQDANGRRVVTASAGLKPLR